MSEGPPDRAGSSARRLTLQVAKPTKESRMTDYDVLVGFRLRLFTLADELGNVSAACRAMGVDHSTSYRCEPSPVRWSSRARMICPEDRRASRDANPRKYPEELGDCSRAAG